MTEEKILADLNKSQREAVTHFQGPALVLAGAGSGKTRVLIRRLAYLISHYGVKSEEILALTFTNKAADEMKERTADLLGYIPRGWVGTFHSFAAGLLRREAEKLGYSSSYVIYDKKDQKKMLKEIMKDLEIDSNDISPARVSGKISRAKSELISPEEYTPGANPDEKKIKELYSRYEARMKESNALDFDDLLMKTCQLFTRFEEVKKYYQNRYRFLLIDEYQDVNKAQYRLSQLISGRRKNIFVVGDPDQSIYGFRGADIKNILNFERDFPEAEVFKLEQNYRSHQKILAAAQSVIKHNKNRKEKDLWSRRSQGSSVTVCRTESGRREAKYVGKRMKDLRDRSNYKYGDMAVMYRTNAQSRVLEDAFMKMNIPYQLVGGQRFYDRKEIKDILAYLRLIYNPHDEAALLRVINRPRRGIGSKTIERVKDFASSQNISLYQAVCNPREIPSLTSAYQTRVKKFADLIEDLREKHKELTLVGLMDAVLKKTGYEEFIQDKEGDDAWERIDNIGELHNVLTEYLQQNPEGNLEGFLEQISLVTDVDNWEESRDHVTLLTLHSAKGLEFPVVFLTGLEEGLFPHGNSMGSEEEIEEERRLCYVGMTRAQEELFLVHAKSRRRFGKNERCSPSRFLQELDESVVRREKFRGERVVDAGFSGDGSESVSDDIFAEEMPDLYPDDQQFHPGEEVVHPKFGSGRVTEVDLEGNGDEILVVDFADGNTRVLMADYAPLEKK